MLKQYSVRPISTTYVRFYFASTDEEMGDDETLASFDETIGFKTFKPASGSIDKGENSNGSTRSCKGVP
jgi:hypothetical protein